MTNERLDFTVPHLRALRWLLSPGRSVSSRVGDVLRAELFASPWTIIAAALNGLILNVVALSLHAGSAFAFFIAADVVLVGGRLLAIDRMHRSAGCGLRTSTDAYLVLAIGWCALQGLMGFFAMRSAIAPLQVVAAMTIIGLSGPICARNNGAPRYALLLVVSCNGPLLAGAVASGDPWLSILALQVPGFLFGVVKVLQRLQSLAISTLEAEQDSYERSRRDALTGLLNRFGLIDETRRFSGALERMCTVFYLDLDGFKPINDDLGHQAGDRLLQAVARRLESAVRTGDILCRFGGDEFVVIAAGMSPAEAEVCATRFISIIADEPYRVDVDRSVRVGVSVGFACCPDDADANEELHRRADVALCLAKACGRGVYRRFQELEEAGAAADVLIS